VSGRPRFIAGAVCPSCAAVDRTVLFVEGDVRERRCVACGHRERMSTAAPLPLAGRFERRPAAADDGVRAVRLPSSGPSARDACRSTPAIDRDDD
jgi:uncharacterized metal-binding protein (TIGR02443 family)